MRQKINESLQRAVEQLPRLSLEQLLAIPVEKMEQHDWITRQETEKTAYDRSVRVGKALSCLCCILLAVIGIRWYVIYGMVDTIVSLDVNPSFEIQMNRKDTVLKLTGLNAKAVSMLENQNFRGKDLESAIEFLIEHLEEEGYLTQEKNTVLLSVRNKKENRTLQIEETACGMLRNALEKKNISPNIIMQSLPKDKELKKEAKKLQISAAKLNLIHQLILKNPDLKEENLSTMTIDELVKLLNDQQKTEVEEPKPSPEKTMSGAGTEKKTEQEKGESNREQEDPDEEDGKEALKDLEEEEREEENEEEEEKRELKENKEEEALEEQEKKEEALEEQEEQEEALEEESSEKVIIQEEEKEEKGSDDDRDEEDDEDDEDEDDNEDDEDEDDEDD